MPAESYPGTARPSAVSRCADPPSPRRISRGRAARSSMRSVFSTPATSPRSTDKAEILAFLEGKIAKWWMPDDVVFVDEIPHTATGKIQKITLRERFGDYVLPTAAAAE